MNVNIPENSKFWGRFQSYSILVSIFCLFFFLKMKQLFHSGLLNMGWLKPTWRQAPHWLSSIYKIVLVNIAKPDFVVFFGLVGTAVYTLLNFFLCYDRKPTNHLRLTLTSWEVNSKCYFVFEQPIKMGQSTLAICSYSHLFIIHDVPCAVASLPFTFKSHLGVAQVVL